MADMQITQASCVTQSRKWITLEIQDLILISKVFFRERTSKNDNSSFQYDFKNVIQDNDNFVIEIGGHGKKIRSRCNFEIN